MSKNKKKHASTPWIWIVLVSIIILGLIAIAIDSIYYKNYYYNSKYSENYQGEDKYVYSENYEDQLVDECPSGYTLCGERCYSCQDGYYLGNDCECYPTEQTKVELAYEIADAQWKEYAKILDEDSQKTNDLVNQYCPDGMPYLQVPTCVNVVQPRLEIYANHIVNAQNFLFQEGDVFGNKQTILANLDDQAYYVTSTANTLNQLVNEYNSWVQTQQNQQEIAQAREEAIYDVIKILSGFAI